MEFIDSTNVIVCVMCIIVVLWLLLRWVVPTERRDLMCPDGATTKDRSICKEGNGKVYNGSRPDENDTVSTLLQKIEIASKTVRRDVVWRRSFIVACIACFAIFLIILRKFPNPTEVIGIIFIITMAVMCMFSFYNYHHYAHPERNIKMCLDKLKKRLRLKNDFQQSHIKQ